MERTVVVTGASGFLGRSVIAAFRACGWRTVGTAFARATALSLRRLDLNDIGGVDDLLAEVRPEVVVHCAANRFPESCETDPDGARKLNVDATRSLAIATSKKSALFIYISTDYVFSGKVGEAPYETDNLPEPTNIYGITKAEGERATLQATQYSGLGIVLRIPVLYGRTDKPEESAINSLMSIVWESQQSKSKIQVDNWAKRYPTNVEDVSRVLVDLASSYLSEATRSTSRPRILQFTSEEVFTKFEICEVLAEILDLPLENLEAASHDAATKSKTQRPYDTHLSVKALEELGILVYTQDFRAWWRRETRAYRK